MHGVTFENGGLGGKGKTWPKRATAKERGPYVWEKKTKTIDRGTEMRLTQKTGDWLRNKERDKGSDQDKPVLMEKGGGEHWAKKRSVKKILTKVTEWERRGGKKNNKSNRQAMKVQFRRGVARKTDTT